MIIIALLILGLCLGSFINAFVWRMRNGRDWVRERSECTHCHHELAAKDLIPVVSYLWLRGKCRYCGKRIEDTPLTELLTPALFIISYLAWPYGFHEAGIVVFALWIVFLVGFVALTVFDLRWYLLPDKVVLPLVGLAAVQVGLLAGVYHGGLRVLLGALWGVLIASGIFYVLFQISQGKWIGGGDVKLGLVIGLLVGGPVHAMLVLFLASLLGTILALPLMATGRAGRASRLPFGPFLMAATVIVYLWGTGLEHWYTAHFLQ